MTAQEFLKENTYSIDCAPGYGEVVEIGNAEQYSLMFAIEKIEGIDNGEMTIRQAIDLLKEELNK